MELAWLNFKSLRILNLGVHPHQKRNRSPRGFLPRPLLRADKCKKQISLGFAKIQIPRKIVFAKPSPHFAPPHCLNTWKAEPQREKCPFHFRKKPPSRKLEKQGTFFLFGVAELSEAVAGLSWSIRFSLETPRAPRVPHSGFCWK